MHLLYGALPVPYVPMRSTRCALHGGTSVRLYASSLLNLALPPDLYSPQSVPLWNDLADPVFDGVRLEGLKSMGNAFLLA